MCAMGSKEKLMEYWMVSFKEIFESYKIAPPCYFAAEVALSMILGDTGENLSDIKTVGYEEPNMYFWSNHYVYKLKIHEGKVSNMITLPIKPIGNPINVRG